MTEIIELQRTENEQLKEIINEQGKQLQRLELIEHQYLQMQRLVYARSTEKLFALPGQFLLGLDAETIEARKVGDGQLVSAYTKQKTEKKPHPGRNQLPAHIERKYINMYPENLPTDASLVDTIKTGQLE
ncbi:MAG: hypothetical protein DI539_23080 [Flavobacterium psychrophilum]|nr:MAG: hypothetical protein DI539_23080 [Flavobacterium psychrophilum]